MCAIKRLSNRLAQRRVLGVINDHRRPCERLQSDPMPTDRETKCADRGDPAGAAQHDCEANHRVVWCQPTLVGDSIVSLAKTFQSPDRHSTAELELGIFIFERRRAVQTGIPE